MGNVMIEHVGSNRLGYYVGLCLSPILKNVKIKMLGISA